MSEHDVARGHDGVQDREQERTAEPDDLEHQEGWETGLGELDAHGRVGREPHFGDLGREAHDEADAEQYDENGDGELPNPVQGTADETSRELERALHVEHWLGERQSGERRSRGRGGERRARTHAGRSL